MEQEKSLFGLIKFISGNVAHVANIASAEEMGDLMNVHVVFEAEDQYILGEVEEVTDEVTKIRFLGEFSNGRYLSGVIRKPVLNSLIRKINDEELKAIVGEYDDSTFKLGRSSIYTDYEVCVDINNLFANHMAVFGNTGSGKSCGVARLVQNIFSNPELVSYNANIFIFDAYGEYKTAFADLGKLNPNYSYKFITTHMQEETDYELKIPFHLLTLDDLIIMMQADKHSQIPILERALKLTKIFSKEDETAERYKDHLIARALIAIIYSNQITANKKNDIFNVLEVCHTKNFDLDTVIQGLGYTRTLSECFEIDSNGNFGESVLITNYILSHIDEELEMTEEPLNAFYSMRDFAAALEFTLISEGFQDNEQLYGDSMLLKVRLNAIINSKISSVYKCDNYISMETFVAGLVANGKQKAQIININLEDIDDTHAKIIVKIMARMFFDFCKTRKQRASIPFHLFLEEAHRYVQKDADVFLIGYNIFDRIAKEGRKYGVLLNIISQRPVEISDTVIAQCSNFLIFKMTHPRDIEYIRMMLPNISADVIEKQKILQPGNCVGFGGAFKLPMVVKMQMPDPPPNSNSCDVNNCWRMKDNGMNADAALTSEGREKDALGQAAVDASIMPNVSMDPSINTNGPLPNDVPSTNMFGLNPPQSVQQAPQTNMFGLNNVTPAQEVPQTNNFGLNPEPNPMMEPMSSVPEETEKPVIENPVDNMVAPGDFSNSSTATVSASLNPLLDMVASNTVESTLNNGVNIDVAPASDNDFGSGDNNQGNFANSATVETPTSQSAQNNNPSAKPASNIDNNLDVNSGVIKPTFIPPINE